MSLDRFERSMLSSAKNRADANTPDPARKAAARRAMLEAAGVAATAATTVATASTTKTAVASSGAAAKTFAFAKLLKIGLLATVVAGGSAVGVHAWMRPAQPQVAAGAASASSTAPAVVAAPPASIVSTTNIPSDVPTFSASELPSVPTARVEAPRPASKPVDSTGDDPLAAEAKILARARDALASGDTNTAKVALREHDAQFPRGALSNEAELLAIDLALANGDRAEARRRAGLLLAKDPASPWRTRLQRLQQEAP